nr:DUF3800 domain-containing protein [uncultured Massilia sp.]
MKVTLNADAMVTDHPEHYGTDAALTLYYDETNNIRKLRLTENGLNVSKHDNFVLGGIVLKPGQSIGDIKELRKLLWIQDSADEIKFDLVAKGDFEKVLDSKKLNKVFTWLTERGIGIHYANLNILNWSILDIVESIVAEDQFIEEFLPYHREMKNELYRFATADLPGFLAMLQTYGYPNIDPSKTGEFIGDVRAFVNRHWPQHPNHAMQMLSTLLSKAKALPELAFLVNEKAGVLIDGFDQFFLNRICTFKNARHVLDEEKEVQKVLDHYQLMHGDSEIDFSFADSKVVPEIQLSDIVVGFLGKYFTFIEKTPMSALLRIRKNLTKTQAQTLKLLGDLIDISDKTSNALLFRITTMDSDWKSDAFLYGNGFPPHLLQA